MGEGYTQNKELRGARGDEINLQPIPATNSIHVGSGSRGCGSAPHGCLSCINTTGPCWVSTVKISSVFRRVVRMTLWRSTDTTPTMAAFHLTAEGVQVAILFPSFHQRRSGPLATTRLHRQFRPERHPDS